ncbi:MAG: DnaJ domain-containing protein [Caldilineales bacterium]|nr:DnaJ domain-containing protein [Caldilineales bacterium]
MPKDLYKLLQVHPEADQEGIEAAYQRLAAKFDPATAPDDPVIAAARQEIEGAYAVLGSPAERAAYDASLIAAPAAETSVEADALASIETPAEAAPETATAAPPPPARRGVPSYAWVAAVAVAAIAIIALVFVLRNRKPGEEQAAASSTVVAQAATAAPSPASVATPAATRAPFPTTDASGPYILPPSIPNFAVSDRPTRSQGAATAPVVMYEWSDYT